MIVDLTAEEIDYIRGVLIATQSCKFTKNCDGKKIKKILNKLTVKVV